MKKIKPLILKLKDNSYPKRKILYERLIVRAIIIKDDKLVFTKYHRDDIFANGSFIETCGGGVETNEYLIDALKREIQEELGYKIEVICLLGLINDYYNLINRKNIIYYYLVRVISKTNSNRLEHEIRYDLKEQILTYEEALNEYEIRKEDKYGSLLYQREIPILKKYKEYINKSIN